MFLLPTLYYFIQSFTPSDYTRQSFYTFSIAILFYIILYFIYKFLRLYPNYSCKIPRFCIRLFKPDESHTLRAETRSLILNKYMLY
jgi:amino acid permease